MADSDTAVSPALLPDRPLALDHPPPAPGYLGDAAKAPSAPDSPRSQPAPTAPHQTSGRRLSVGPLGSDALSSDSSRQSGSTAAGDVPRVSAPAPDMDGAVSCMPALERVPLPLLPHAADTEQLRPAERPLVGEQLSRPSQSGRVSPWVAAWLAQMPSPAASSRGGDDSPRPPVDNAPPEDRLHRHPAVSRTASSSTQVSAVTDEDAGLQLSTAQRSATSAAVGKWWAYEPLEGTQPSGAGAGRDETGHRSGGTAVSAGQQRSLQSPAAQLLPALPEAPRPARRVVADDSYHSATDMHPAQLAMALHSTAPVAPARTLVRRSGGPVMRRKRVRPAILSVVTPTPLGLGTGSGLPPARMPAMVSASGKVRAIVETRLWCTRDVIIACFVLPVSRLLACYVVKHVHNKNGVLSIPCYDGRTRAVLRDYDPLPGMALCICRCRQQ